MSKVTPTAIVSAILLTVATVASAAQPPNENVPPATVQLPADTVPAPAMQQAPPAGQNPANAPVTLGAGLEDVPEILRSHLAASLPGQRGVLVRDVQQGSAAQQAGLQPSDVVLQFNDTAVSSPQQLQSLVNENGLRAAELQILQAGVRRQVTLVPQARMDQRVVREPLGEPVPSQRSSERVQQSTADPNLRNPYRRGSTVFSYGAQTPNGSFSLQGTDVDSMLRADFWDRHGRRRQVTAAGAAHDLDAQLDQLPDDIRDLLRGRIQGRDAWDSWFSDDLPRAYRSPY